MHVEVPKKGALASFKAFAAEYAMIVVSILTALALEHAATSWHHQHQAHEAAQRIEAEIAYNLGELQQCIKKNDAEIKKFTELRDFVRDGINDRGDKSGKEKDDYNAEFSRRLNEKMHHQISFHATSPTLRREAWEVAVASQAASWLDSGSLQRFSTVYAMQRDIAPMLASTSATITGPTVLGALPRLQLHGKGKDQELYRLFSEICNTLEVMQSGMQQLEKSIKDSTVKA